MGSLLLDVVPGKHAGKHAWGLYCLVWCQASMHGVSIAWCGARQACMGSLLLGVVPGKHAWGLDCLVWCQASMHGLWALDRVGTVCVGRRRRPGQPRSLPDTRVGVVAASDASSKPIGARHALCLAHRHEQLAHGATVYDPGACGRCNRRLSDP